MYKIALFVLAIVALFALTQAAGTNSICDRYSGSKMFPNNTALLTGFVQTAFGRLLDQDITAPYFTGAIGRDMFNMTIDYTKNTTAYNLLAYHLIAFFGAPFALNCTDAGFPVYNGSTDMAAVHKNNMIDREAFEVFNQQLVNIAQVLGFNHSDYAGLGDLLESFRSDICTQPNCNVGPHTIFVGSGGNFYTPSSGYSFPAGTNITWVWSTNVTATHSVVQGSALGGCTALSGGFNSGRLSGGKNYTQTFNTPGTYYFFCDVSTHCAQGMYGTFTITAAASTTAATTATTAASTASTAATTASTAATTATTAASTATTAATSLATAASSSLTTRGNNSGASAASVLVALVVLVAALLF